MAKFCVGMKSIPDLAVVKGDGCYCIDNRGVRYVDMTAAFGPNILGHGRREIKDAVSDQIENGVLFSWEMPAHEELAKRICQNFPNAEQCLFVKSGSEAASAAIRLARAFTGRDVVLRCGFNGWHDQLISPHTDWHEYDANSGKLKSIPGVPNELDAVTRILRAPVAATLDAQLSNSAENIAALIIDPVQLAPHVDETIKVVRDLCTHHGILLILDEVKTAFRVLPGSIGSRYNIKADLSVFSKAVANGFPLSGVAGRREILNCSRDAKIKGTYNGELASIRASEATLDIIAAERVYENLDRLGEKLISAVNLGLKEAGLTDFARAVPYHWNCMPYLKISPHGMKQQQAVQKRFAALLRERHILWLPSHMNYICHAMNDDVIACVTDAILESLSQLSEE